ncbi:hypothetical protein PGT21_008426 [Puccinia graminis f. sp. tritici]|uniref:BED-type domain-containing protein n=1 Tax=Puccinia graminis f. sp. tritici TaxID=56615 RepID=A0A5B0NMW3_PUCGR|nr:hypothetical protein PGTUg99_024990 [Puccinia graminis f. sp. tritici]KAA1090641.1 hypothetical protein PGT21_008426 [Puccinia graminis f. sp. tritici]
MALNSSELQGNVDETSEAQGDNSTDQSQRPPRRSSRASSITMPVNMVVPSSDSRIRVSRPGPQAQSSKRRAVASPSPADESESVRSVSAATVTKKSKSKKKKQRQSSPAANTPKKKKKQKSQAASTSQIVQVHSAGEAYDYDQESSEGSVEIEARPNKTKDAKKAETQELLRYFEAPFSKKGDPPNTALNFRCKFCKGVYRGQINSTGNLKTHRDGSTQADKSDKGCPNRNKAKLAGFTLPPSVAECRALAASKDGVDANQPGIKGFLDLKPLFVNKVLNQLVMIWQIRQALPWTRIEDPYLRAAFQYSNPKALLYGRRWSADESKKLYSVLKKHVFNELNNLNTRFTLIHDVWTTKGNRFAFIGASAAYINDEWEYVVRHLTLKMIPWKHTGRLLARPIAAILKKQHLYKKICTFYTALL